jgi:riboflavin kinase/FMN adenylyltransferase
VKLSSLADVEPRPRRVAIGMFDGVHLGHREVIRGADTVVTFEPHPQAVVAPGTEPRRLTTLERKAELVATLGVEEMVVIDFNQDFAHRSAEYFVDHLLVERLHVTHVSVGENFHFGRTASGGIAMLEADHRFTTRTVPMLEVDGEVVSSSHIRALVAGGAVHYADRLLGAPFAITGEVAHGDKRGRELGFPTANLVPQVGHVLPGHGVYACSVRLPRPDGAQELVAAATNVGVRPQFGTGLGELIEAFLIDWSGDLYGQQIRVEFLRRLRGEKRFESVDALVAQMGRDVEEARLLVAEPASGDAAC